MVDQPLPEPSEQNAEFTSSVTCEPAQCTRGHSHAATNVSRQVALVAVARPVRNVGDAKLRAGEERLRSLRTKSPRVLSHAAAETSSKRASDVDRVKIDNPRDLS